MKSLLSSIFLFILCSCSVYQNYRSDKYFSSIPLKPNSPKVDLYFGTKNPIDTSYTEIKTISIANTGFKNSKTLSIELATKAKKQGLDAVVGIDRTDYGQLYGVGIKFHNNINYLYEIVKTEKAFLIEGDKEVSLFTAYLNPKGDLDSLIAHHEKASEIHDNMHYAYSLQHLVDEQRNWRYKNYEFRIFKRQQFKLENWPLKTVSIFYDNFQRIEKLKLKHHETLEKETIKFEYKGKSPFVSKKYIIRADGSGLKEVFTYDDMLRITSKIIYKTLKPGEERPFYIVYYTYYSNDYLPNLLQLDSINYAKKNMLVEES